MFGECQNCINLSFIVILKVNVLCSKIKLTFLNKKQIRKFNPIEYQNLIGLNYKHFMIKCFLIFVAMGFYS